jgi:hypothetical protein
MFLLIRHSKSGVWFGEFDYQPAGPLGPGYYSKSARRLRRWYGPSDLSGVAAGATLKSESWTTPPVEVFIPATSEMAEILTPTEKGRKNLEAVQVRDRP